MWSAWWDEDLNMVLLKPVKQSSHSPQEHLSHGSWKAQELVPISFVQQGSSTERERGCQT